VTVAELGAPMLSTSGSGVVRVAPAALFQFDCVATPAVSAGSIAVALVPTKSIATGRRGVAAGTIWTPLIGARRVSVAAGPGVALRVKLLPLTVNFT